MKPKLIIVTGNSLKFRELSNELSKFFDCEQGTIEGFEIQGKPEEILRHKLAQAFEKFKQSVLVDDTSVHFDFLGGFPGPYVKDLLDHMKPHEAGEKFAGTRMTVVCRLGLCYSPDSVIIGEGTIHGVVVNPTTKDHQGRQFDLIMQVDGTDRPMIEFTLEEKNKFSHRGNAMRDLISKL